MAKKASTKQEWITAWLAAQVAGCTRANIYRLADKATGGIRTRKEGGTRLLCRADVEAYAARRSKGRS